MNVEAGKYYRTRSGAKAYVAYVGNPFGQNRSPFSARPAVGFVDSGSGPVCWELDGRATIIASDYQHPLDLVAEWREPVVHRRWVAWVQSPDHNGGIGTTGFTYQELPGEAVLAAFGKVLRIDEITYTEP